MGNQYIVFFFGSVRNFIEALPDDDQGKINGVVTAIESGDFKSLYIKTLKSPIKELIIKKYRLIFFVHKNTFYFIGAFVKKTAKTPKIEIENAEKIFKKIMEIINNKRI